MRVTPLKMAGLLALGLVALTPQHGVRAESLRAESLRAERLVAESVPPSLQQATPLAFEASRVQEDIQFLASPGMMGRGLGSHELELAADYLARQLRLSGVPGGMPDGSYFQSFDVQTDVTLGSTNRLEQKGGGAASALTLGEAWHPFSFSESASFQGEVVFVGYGISAPEIGYDDFKDQDVKGKVVVALRGLPSGNPSGPFSSAGAERYGQARFKAMNARERGAAALILVDREEGGNLPVLSRGQVVSSAGIVTLQLRRREAAALLQQGKLSLDVLQKQLDTQFKPASAVVAGVSLSGQVSLERKSSPVRNVLGYLEGSDPVLKDELIVIGAHYDHLGLGGESSLAPDQKGVPHVGADDNASGTAGMLELARYLAKGPRLKRSVLLMGFTAEESGLGGSAYYTRAPVKPLDKTVLMINLDMVGRLREDKLSIQGVDTGQGMRERLAPLVEAVGLKASFSGDGYGPSDHTPFNARQVPVLFFFTGAHSDYHRPSDTPDKINTQGLVKILDLVARTVKSVAEEPTRVAYVKLTSAPPPQLEGGGGSRGYGAYLGTIPDFTEVPGGVALTGVRPGSPAEQAGIKGGDLIIKLAGKGVQNLQDFTYVLREHKPGDEVEIVVKRDGKEVTLKAVLGKRQ